MRQRFLNLALTLVAGSLAASAAVWAAPAIPNDPTAREASLELIQASANASASQRKRVMTFPMMGQPEGVKLTGLNRTIDLNSGVRLDELVTKATLTLKMLYPPGMKHDQSFLRVYVNNLLSAIHQLSEKDAGITHTVDIELDPVLFSDFATVRIEYDGTYQANCISPSNPTLRVDIRPESTLTMTSVPLTLADDLSMLPAPFFDPRDSRKLVLPIVLPKTSNFVNLKAAGVLASWFGAQSSYRQADFEVAERIPTERHSVILSTGDHVPPGFDFASMQGPTLLVDSLPERPWIKRLYVMGRNDDELLNAVYGLVIEGQVLSGKSASIKTVTLGPKRQPYDAPRYVPTNRPVRFAELMDYPAQLETSTDRPLAKLNMRLPPDLFSWASGNIPMSLKYRYTAPSRWNDSLLSVEINKSLIQSFRLAPRSEEQANRLSVELLNQSQLTSVESLQIPAFRVGSNNEITFGFAFMPEGERNCAGVSQPARGAVDPESTIDFSKLPHYTRMPNLTAFANGGYPFSIYADLEDTAIVLNPEPTPLELKGFLNLMGLFGQWTGLPASRVNLISSENPQDIGTRHWIAFGTSDRLAWLNAQKMSLPMVLSETERSLGLPSAVKFLGNAWRSEDEIRPSEQAKALVMSKGTLGAILGFESHLAKQKTGIVITGTDDTGLERALSAMSDYGDISQIRGSVTLIRGESIQGYTQGEMFVSGNLDWWLKLRIAFSEYPALIAVGGSLAGLILAVLIFGWLSNRASRRNRGG